MLVTLEDTSDPMAWSGSAIEIRRALEASVEKLTVIDHIPVKRSPVHSVLRAGLGKYSNREPRYPLWMTKPALREFARVTAAAMRKHKPQAVVSLSSQCLIYLHEFYKGPAIPTFFFNDTSWMLWLEVYKDHWPYPIGAMRHARREASGMQHCDGLILASEWARQDAITRFQVPADKVHVQPMGASWVPTVDDATIKASVLARPKDRVDLLFIGKEWLRKDGPFALQVARALRASGKVGEVRMHIVGCHPELEPGDKEFVTTYGLLRRADPEDGEKLRKLLTESHFVILPTRAECYGLVYTEAQAFAIPPIARAVGAIPSTVLDGKTGILQPLEDGPEPYVRRIEHLLSGNREAYTRMALAGREHFLARLNWPAFGRGIAKTIEASLDQEPVSARVRDDGYGHGSEKLPLPPPLKPSHSHAAFRSRSSQIG